MQDVPAMGESFHICQVGIGPVYSRRSCFRIKEATIPWKAQPCSQPTANDWVGGAARGCPWGWEEVGRRAGHLLSLGGLACDEWQLHVGGNGEPRQPARGVAVVCRACACWGGDGI